MSKAVTKFCFFHAQTGLFLSKKELVRYSVMDPTKEPSYSDAHYGELTGDIDNALFVSTQEVAKVKLKEIVRQCHYLELPDATPKLVINPLYLTLKEVLVEYSLLR